MRVLGIDIGTQSLKVVVVEEGQRLLGSASRSYEPSYPRDGWAEQDPALWEEALRAALPEALERAGVAGEDIAALAVSGQLDGCVPVDEEGRALGPCLLWMDRRGGATMPELDDERREELRQRTGLVFDGTHMGAKIRWLQREGSRAARFHQPVSYLVERLCGRAVMDTALASTTMLYELRAQGWSEELLGLFEIDGSHLPSIDAPDAVAGPLRPVWAEALGLRVDTPVAVGTGDDFSTPLGAGIVDPGPLAVVLGTAEVVGCVSDQALVDPSALVETHGYLGRYFIENPGWLSGGALRWLRRLLSIGSDVELDTRAAQVAPGAEGLLCVPALSGLMSPEWIDGARGAFYGFSPVHGAGHVARAFMESCAYAMKDVAAALEAMGLSIEHAVIAGGGAQSALWGQIRADVLQRPLRRLEQWDTCALGASLLATAAVHPGQSVVELARAWPHRYAVHDPSSEKRQVYDDSYGRYRQLIEALRPMYQTT